MNLPGVLRRILAGWIRSQRRPDPYPAAPPLSGELLAGHCVLITGAGRNIGRAIALEMARQGATILFTETNPERAASLEREMAQMGVRSWGLPQDAADPGQIPALCHAIKALGMTVDLLVNNAALQVEKGFLALEATEWQRSCTANIIGPSQLSRAIAAALIADRRSGSILFITSVHEWEPSLWPAYSSAKAALGMMIREMAVELAPHDIRVNGIAPGWVTEDCRISRLSPLHGSSIDPVYIGRAAVFLSSEHHSRYTTGTVLTVDAGLSLLSNRTVNTRWR